MKKLFYITLHHERNTAMKKKAVIISALGENSFSPQQVKQLKKVLDVTFYSQMNEMDEADFINACREAHIIGITRRPFKDFNSTLVASCPQLRAIAIFSTGYEWLDIDYLHKQGVIVSYIPDYCVVTVAEHTIALMLSMSRRIHLSFDKVRGIIPSNISLRGWELRGKSLGIIGFGRIGQEIARLAKPFGMKIFYYDKKQIPTTFQFLPLKDLLIKSDIVVLAASKTRGELPIISQDQIILMKNSVYIINVGRSSLVDNEALLAAIIDKRVAGYAVDDRIEYFLIQKEIEPGRILQTGHTAWYSTEALARGTKKWVKNIISLATDNPKNIIGSNR